MFANSNGRVCPTLLLARLSTEGEYVRIRDPDTQMTEVMTSAYKTREIAVRQKVTEMPPTLFQGFWLRQLKQPERREVSPVISSREICNSGDRIKMSLDAYGTAGVVRMMTREQSRDTYGWPHIFWLKFGFDDAFNPVCMVAKRLVWQYGETGFKDDLFEKSLKSRWIAHLADRVLVGSSTTIGCPLTDKSCAEKIHGAKGTSF